VVLVAAAIITLVRSGRRAADGDGEGFWSTAPRQAADTLLPIYAPGLTILGMWAFAAVGVILARALGRRGRSFPRRALAGPACRLSGTPHAVSSSSPRPSRQ
jgi:hypothetical protein